MEETVYLCFRRGMYHYAITNQKVMRILRDRKLHPLPFADAVYQGVEVVDDRLAVVVDIDANRNKGKENGYIIFVEFKGDIIGVYADELIGIERISDQLWVESDLPYASLCCEMKQRTIYLLQP